MKKKLLFFFSTLFILGACSPSNDSSSTNEDSLTSESTLIDSNNYRTYYQLLVYSFRDSDGDGIGDFKGIADKLDYLKDLGIQGIWLSPILKASSYHAYDIEDYYTINPSYNVTIDGKIYDITYLLNECHKRDIKVVMDLVLNHTSRKSTWYKQHKDWYGKDNRFGFPELDYDKSEVRTAVKEVGKYWLNQGFDGFRLDAAMWIYNSGNDRHAKNYEFWKDWCSTMREVKKDCYIIGEVLDSNHDLAYDYAKAGFNSTFDFNALGHVIDAVKEDDKDYASKTATDIKKATGINANYILARALSNHDIGRFNEAHADSSDKAYYVEDINQIKLANAVNALTPGNAFIYYGDELGLKGTCPEGYTDMNYRTPMPWESERTNSVKYFLNFKGNGETTSNTLSTKSPEKDKDDPESIYRALKGALMVKNTHETLQRGVIKSISGLDTKLNGFDVKDNGTTIRVVFNASASEVTYPYSGSLLYNLRATNSDSHITMLASSLIAYQL